MAVVKRMACGLAREHARLGRGAEEFIYFTGGGGLGKFKGIFLDLYIRHTLPSSASVAYQWSIMSVVGLCPTCGHSQSAAKLLEQKCRYGGHEPSSARKQTQHVCSTTHD